MDQEPKIQYDVIGFVSESQSCFGKTVVHQTPPDHWGRNSHKMISWRGKSQDVTGLYYFGTRYYNPQTATFISPDPLGFFAGMNLYAYAHNDPINFLDPDGRYANRAWDNVQETVASPNFWSATFQTGGGAAQVAAGVGAAGAAFAAGPATGGAAWLVFGAAAAASGAMGVDNILTGIKSSYTGQHQTTKFHQAMREAGFSQKTASYINMGADFFSTLGAGAAAASARGAFGRMVNEAAASRGAGASINNDLTKVGLSPSEVRSISSWNKMLEEHRAKLAAFIENPEAFDNKGFLKNAPSVEIRQKIIDRRIRHLNNEIFNFEKQIAHLSKKGNLP